MRYKLVSSSLPDSLKNQKRRWEFTPICEEGACNARLVSCLVKKGGWEPKRKGQWKARPRTRRKPFTCCLPGGKRSS